MHVHSKSLICKNFVTLWVVHVTFTLLLSDVCFNPPPLLPQKLDYDQHVDPNSHQLSFLIHPSF